MDFIFVDVLKKTVVLLEHGVYKIYCHV